jgi:hypothetical protein
MKTLVFIFLFGFFAATAKAGTRPYLLTGESLHALKYSTNAILFSLDPMDRSLPEDKSSSLDGFKILGQTTLDSAQVRLAAGAFRKAAEDWDKVSANCFDPRHALMINFQGHMYDFLLCYQCHSMEVFKDDKSFTSIGVTGSPKILNDLLTAAHLPLPHDKE